MTDPDRSRPDDPLEAYFRAAREATPTPTAALLARIADDAVTAQARRRAVRARTGRGGWRAALRRSWPEAAALVAATCAGIWIGVSPPDAVADVLGAGTAEGEFAALVEPATVFDVALLTER
ncbi:hypothetical protein [Roseivivax isoporae]|uniref:Dihydroorotate dehydrogenase n=1 Tax=Roseivivax isoporae LMG 25204 TaxID=1449351 RepID=X7F6E8_9RHOB|nr:hypothetical protein [Roseivivax isoporae]ETX28380.1 hypothetical protein RISW2_06690 [Roseivivax isoporae LMG 25204]